MDKLTLNLFGGFRLSRNSQELSVARKAQALLAYLSIVPNHSAARQAVATLLWSDRAEDQARNSLRQSIFSLRQTLNDSDGQILNADRDMLGLEPNSIDLDVAEFESLSKGETKEQLERAMEFYAGDLLENFTARSEGFDDWLALERRRFRDLAADTLEKLVSLHTEAGETESAIETAQRVLALDPAREETHCTLMRLYDSIGRRSAALKQFQICEEAMRRELDADPSPETIRLYSEISNRDANLRDTSNTGSPIRESGAAGEASPSARAGPGSAQPGAASPEAAVSAAANAASGPRRKPVLAVAAVLVLAVALAGGAIWYAFIRTPSTQTAAVNPSELMFPLPDKPSIAVLPFDNLSGDPEQGYFSDGITEDVITALSRFPDLFVIARHSTFTYKNKQVNVRQVSKELGVRYVLGGSVQKAGDRARIKVQLVDAISGVQMWAERFERDMTDIFALQDEVTQKIAAALDAKISVAELERVKQKYTSNLEAYDLVLRGREKMFQLTRAANIEARDMFKKAVALDPRYARAYIYLGWTHLNDWRLGWSVSREQSLEQAYHLSNKAISLDDSESDSHLALGEVFLWIKQHDQALLEIERALSLNRNNAGGYASLGNVLTWAGKPSDAIEQIETAMRLNPHFPVNYIWYRAHALFVMERYDEAISALRQVRDSSPDFVAGHLYSAACFAQTDQASQATSALNEALKLNPYLSATIMRERLPYKNADELALILDALKKAGLPD